jgi:hypothetical protein
MGDGMISFAQAREAVERTIGATKPNGFEDSDAFLVVLVDPPTDDTVVFVSKTTGNARRVPMLRPGMEERVGAMTRIAS